MLTLKLSGSMVKVTSATTVPKTTRLNREAPRLSVVKKFSSTLCTELALSSNEISVVK